MSRTPDHLPHDLAGVGEALESHRPHPTALELDRVKRRAMAGGSGSANRYPKESFMRSRFAVAAMLVAGFTMSGAGAALGASVIAAQSDNASAAQYGTPGTTPPQQQGTPSDTPPQVLGDVAGGGEGTPPSTPSGETLGESAGAGEVTPPSIPAGGTLGESASGGGAPEATAAAQAPRQLSTGSGEAGAPSNELPFTGYASGVVLLLGLALLVTGFTLRRSIGRAPAQS